MGGFTHIFEKSSLFFQRQGEILYRERRKRSTNVINSHFSIKIPLVFSNPRIDTELNLTLPKMCLLDISG
jgi:hypothetical protein